MTLDSLTPTKPGYYWFRFTAKDSPWQPCEVYWSETTGLITLDTLGMQIIGSRSSFGLADLSIEWGEELRHDA